MVHNYEIIEKISCQSFKLLSLNLFKICQCIRSQFGIISISLYYTVLSIDCKYYYDVGRPGPGTQSRSHRTYLPRGPLAMHRIEVTHESAGSGSVFTEDIERVQVQVLCLGDSERKGESHLCFGFGAFTEDCPLVSVSP